MLAYFACIRCKAADGPLQHRPQAALVVVVKHVLQLTRHEVLRPQRPRERRRAARRLHAHHDLGVHSGRHRTLSGLVRLRWSDGGHLGVAEVEGGLKPAADTAVRAKVQDDGGAEDAGFLDRSGGGLL